jgi:hypothetical protein
MILFLCGLAAGWVFLHCHSETAQERIKENLLQIGAMVKKG